MDCIILHKSEFYLYEKYNELFKLFKKLNVDCSPIAIRKMENNYYFIILENDNKIVCAAQIYVNDELCLKYVIVPEKYRKMGYAKKIINHIIENKNQKAFSITIPRKNRTIINKLIKNNFIITKTEDFTLTMGRA